MQTSTNMDALDNLEIRQRLGYDDVVDLKDKTSPLKKQQKPIQKQPQKERFTIISPTKSKKALMRSVSALGMEDPVFDANSAQSKLETKTNNFFDDMALQDMPKGMQDLISVASDPTDDQVNGVLEPKCNINHSNHHESNASLDLLQSSECLLRCETETPKLEDTSASSSGAPLTLSPVFLRKSNLPSQEPLPDSFRWEEELSGSGQHIPLPPQLSHSVSLNNYQTQNEEASTCDTLLAEAAMALEQSGTFTDIELLETAKHQHKCHPTATSSSHKDHNRSTNNNQLSTFPYTSSRRNLPNWHSIFPTPPPEASGSLRSLQPLDSNNDNKNKKIKKKQQTMHMSLNLVDYKEPSRRPKKNRMANLLLRKGSDSKK